MNAPPPPGPGAAPASTERPAAERPPENPNDVPDAQGAPGDAGATVDPPPGAAAPRAAPRDARYREYAGWIVAIVLLALVAAWIWLYHALQQQRGVAEMQARELEAAQAAAANAQREAREVQLRLGELEQRIAQVSEQRAALDQLYLDISRGRDDSILLEVERLISLAQQELQISGNVPTAIAALQSADTRLARLERPQFVALRRALQRDVEKLRAVAVPDTSALALRLDQVAQGVDAWPMLAQPPAGPPPVAPAPAKDASKGAAAKGAASGAKGAGRDKGKAEKAAPPPAETATAPRPTLWERVRGWLHREFGDLVRIREVDAPEALLVSDAQQALLRQQVKLRLLEARTALLARNERVYRRDIEDARALLAKYFDARAPVVASAQAQLAELAQAKLQADVPGPTESVAALQALTGRR